ncbi:ATP synthase subunit delta [Desulfurobacterium thermolithotrophum DSM 11699]|uniref:ATP synthase subunit delta n=1 Tax=Desulfurobacterium thermolithotrophum (strain DSM 11699 / BSA) TaxID=868864 RepID=F0S0T3_DESTD|nr:ATP synthase F1 subunit delta [Desulfurobacterium thermolithotrophum]ADY73886.1 ATP synthase subunit delta [Desulfurobacterium thermolithotrophum DSM 11699]
MRLEVRIARRYAKALADVLPNEKLEKVNEEVKTLLTLLDDKAIRYFKSPVVPTEKKKKLVEQVLEKVEVTEELKKVLLLMAEKDRLGILREFASEFEKFVDFRLGKIKAEIVSAVEIDEETLSKIKAKIEELFGKKAEISVKLDPSLIGGFIVKVADKVLDASIKTQLETLKKAIVD